MVEWAAYCVRMCTVKAERWMNDFPHPLWRHWNGLQSQPCDDKSAIDDVPLIGVDSEMPRQITLSRKCLLASRECTHKWPDHDVVAGSDSVGIVHQL